MKNLFSFFTLAAILFSTSFTNAAIIQPNADQGIESFEILNSKSNYHSTLSVNMDTKNEKNGSDIIEVSKLSSSITGNELNVNFTSAANFFNVDLAANQTLIFADGNGNTVSLPFTANSHSYSNGFLQVAFNIGNNNIGGLDLKVVQYIVIDDILVD